MVEPEFFRALVGRTGCGILCDLTNLYVSSANLGMDARAYLAALPAGAVKQMHLAGHRENHYHSYTLLIDDHASRVSAPVWDLYRHTLGLFDSVPALVEWDAALPTLATLMNEAMRADEVCQRDEAECS